MKCPCGSIKNFDACCQPIINGDKEADTAEQLMRSRYSAYQQKNAVYIQLTYAKEKQIDNSISDIQQWMDETTWCKLEIISTDKNVNSSNNKNSDIKASYDFVEFCANYFANDELWQLHENSRFIKENGLWRYLDGDIKQHKRLQKVTRNSPCPCGSARKYKRCCMLEA
ncbi:YchJ family protein [Thalassotalea crassostreae]|uniref:YchJ family protein n=1 Tax=Thalassotalea crassostreae TaxID=1763536 RepID=UPI000837F820|nr:YchJ family protein [Thalassotalea crassostreae]